MLFENDGLSRFDFPTLQAGCAITGTFDRIGRYDPRLFLILKSDVCHRKPVRILNLDPSNAPCRR